MSPLKLVLLLLASYAQLSAAPANCAVLSYAPPTDDLKSGFGVRIPLGNVTRITSPSGDVLRVETGGGISQVGSGDFNGDGTADLAVADLNTNSGYQIQILLGNGDGTFRFAPTYPTGFGANRAAVADLNGDGKLDLIVGHCCGETDDTYLLGNGDGTFQTEVEFQAGASLQALAPADWSGSGRPDLAVVEQIQTVGGARSQPTQTSVGFLPALANNLAPVVVSGASFAAGPLAPAEIVTLLGYNLATDTVASTATLPPPILGTTAVSVTDSTGNLIYAPLYYVSPTQINLEIPDTVALGSGSITVMQADGTAATAPVLFANTAPGIFQLNSSGLTAAQVVQAVNGFNSFLPVYQVGPSNSIIPLPIDLSQGQVFLGVYGTGLRHATNVTATVGGEAVPVSFHGPQGIYAGEDQVNLGPLPASLAGRGSVDIVVTVDSQIANTTNVTFK